MLQQDQEKYNLLRRAHIFLFHAAPRCIVHRESLQVSRGRSRGREKDVACRENVSARETFRVKCPLVHLQPPPPKSRLRDVQLSFVGNNGTCGDCTIWGTLILQNGNSSRTCIARETYLKNAFFIHQFTVSLFHRQLISFLMEKC